MPASWLPGSDAADPRRSGQAPCASHRLPPDAPVESYSTPRRLTARIAKIAERQTGSRGTAHGPPGRRGVRRGRHSRPLPRRALPERTASTLRRLERIETPKGTYLGYRRHQRGKAAVDVLPEVLATTLRSFSFPKAMHWDAFLEDGKGELLFGRPIRWILYLYGGRVVPFTIRRTELAESASVQEVISAAVTYGHRHSDHQREGRARREGPDVRGLPARLGRTLRDPRSAGAPGPHRAGPRGESTEPRRARRRRRDAAFHAPRRSAGSDRISDGDGRNVLEGVPAACPKKC